MKTLVNFAQHRQDIILAHALRDIDMREIFWIDVGANDPVNISVTLLFSMMGGRGINIEPQEMYKERYKKLRDHDINLFVGIGEAEGDLVIRGTGDTATMMDNGGIISGKSYRVPVVTLTSVFEKYVPKNQEVHFLKIDVEGFETECLRGMDLDRFKPWIICVECLESEEYDEYETKLMDANYVFAYYDGQNRYYVLKEKQDIVNRFTEMKHIDEYYEIISIQDATRYLSYEQSTSWKITAPLRKISAFLSRLKK